MTNSTGPGIGQAVVRHEPVPLASTLAPQSTKGSNEMTDDPKLPEMRQRLADLDADLKERMRAHSTGTISGEHAEDGARIEARAAALHARLPDEGNQEWHGVAAEIERDVYALEQDFRHWVSRLDRHFREQER